MNSEFMSIKQKSQLKEYWISKNNDDNKNNNNTTMNKLWNTFF